jgi:hypothetical protein
MLALLKHLCWQIHCTALAFSFCMAAVRTLFSSRREAVLLLNSASTAAHKLLLLQAMAAREAQSRKGSVRSITWCHASVAAVRTVDVIALVLNCAPGRATGRAGDRSSHKLHIEDNYVRHGIALMRLDVWFLNSIQAKGMARHNLLTAS